MCDCAEVPGFVNANSDIAGVGVVLAFSLSSLLTFFAIAVGWFTDSIDDSNLNGVDYLVVDHLRSILRRPKIPRESVPQTYLDSKARRVKGLEKFVLAQSDQQLVTGTAILIAAFSKPCSTDMYHFAIVGALAWFSSTTHLATLQLLRDYLVKHTVVRNLKVMATMILLGFLIIAQTLSYAPVDWTSPAVCSWGQLANIEPRYRILIFEMFLFWTVAYGSALANLYLLTSKIVAHQVILILRRQWPSSKNEAQNEPKAVELGETAVSSTTSVQTAAEGQDTPPTAPREAAFRYSDSTSIGWLQTFVGRISIVLPVQQEIRGSFLSTVLALYFLNSLGVVGVAMARWHTTVLVVGDENEMGFGQIVPLLLLTLPLLAVVEVYNEAHVEAHAQARAQIQIEEHGKQGRSSDSTTISADHTTSSIDPSVPPKLPQSDTSTSSDESFGPPKHTDTESGLRLVRTLPNHPTSPVKPLGPTLDRSVTSPTTITTNKQRQPGSSVASSEEKAVDLYTQLLFRRWLYLLISLDIMFYTLLSLSFNNLVPVVGFPLNMGYIVYCTILVLVAIIVPAKRTWVHVRKEFKS